jgi:hypothetical protein
MYVHWKDGSAIVNAFTSWARFIPRNGVWAVEGMCGIWPQDKWVLEAIVAWIRDAPVKGFGDTAEDAYLCDMEPLPDMGDGVLTNYYMHEKAHMIEAVERVGRGAPAVFYNIMLDKIVSWCEVCNED